ncbi:MAG: hypothetical protein AB8B59_17690 [Maribacter sp.]
MKKLLFIVTLLSIGACGENSEGENQKMYSELKEYSAFEATESNTKKFIEDYLMDLKSPDWKSRIPKYLKPNPNEFLKEHSAFRQSYTNYKSTIKHMMIDDNECIVWLSITANYASPYPVDSGNYADEAIAGFEAKNQELSWDETWYFDVVDGRFGDKWGILKDYNAILEDLRTVE